MKLTPINNKGPLFKKKAVINENRNELYQKVGNPHHQKKQRKSGLFVKSLI